MPAVDRLARNVSGEITPQRERPAIVVVPARQRPGCAPQGECRAGDAAACGAVGGVVVTVDTRSGTVLLADGVDVRSVAERRHIGIADRIVESAGGAAPLRAQ